MRKESFPVPVRKPRSGVVRALISYLRPGAGRHPATHLKRIQSTDDSDLAQRVRETGEW